jgi:hypothetical protein
MNTRSGTVAIAIGLLTATIPTIVLFQAVTFSFIVPLVGGIFCIGLGVVAIRSEGALLRHVGGYAGIIMLITIGVPFGMIACDSRSGYPIVMVVPEGYKGPVKLVLDRKRGVDVPLEDGKYTYHVPRSGTLLIKDDSPFLRWHSTTAMYANGKSIPIDFEGTLPPDAVSYSIGGYAVTTRGGKEEHYMEGFVGTKNELREYSSVR